MSKYIIGLVVLVLFFWLLGYFVGDNFYRKSEPQPQPEEWCEVGEINSRGELVYSQDHAGETEFSVLATINGPKLMAKCK